MKKMYIYMYKGKSYHVYMKFNYYMMNRKKKMLTQFILDIFVMQGVGVGWRRKVVGKKEALEKQGLVVSI